MRGRVGLAVLLGAALMLVGCNESTSEAKKYECQQWLNSGNYEKLLDKSSQCGNEQEQQMYRAAAHAGKAGFTISALIRDLTDEGEDQDFVERLGRNATAASVQDLNESKRIYGLLIKPDAENDTAQLRDVCRRDSEEYNQTTRYQKDACFIRPLVSTAQLAGQMKRIRALADLDVDDPENMTPEEEEAVAEELATLINDGELELLAETLGQDDTETAEAVDEAKKEICEYADDSDDVTNCDYDADDKITNVPSGAILAFSKKDDQGG